MAVVIETTLGDLTVDLYTTRRPRACLNFLKLCKMKYYNYNLFHSVQQGFIAQTGDPTGSGDGGESIFGVLEGIEKRYFEGESQPKIRHTDFGMLSMVSTGNNMLGSQFFFTLDSDLTSLDTMHIVIGEVTEGHDVLRKLNEAICDTEYRPYQDIRITHTVILEDPFEDPKGFQEPTRSPSPSTERLQGGRIAPDEAIDETEGKTEQEIIEMQQEREAKARATILEIVGDLPDADMAPPENVLFVCKLNPVTTDDDLEIIFSRFGKINSCEVIRDKISGDSLQYAFVEFDNRKSCEDAYFKMDNVLIDDRRIHVDFSQSVSKVKWRGKGRGVILAKDRDGSEDTISKEHDSKHERKERNMDHKHRRGGNGYNRNDREYKERQRDHDRSRERNSRDDNRGSRRGYVERRDERREYNMEYRQEYSSNRRPDRYESSRHTDYRKRHDERTRKDDRKPKSNSDKRRSKRDSSSSSSPDEKHKKKKKKKRSS